MHSRIVSCIVVVMLGGGKVEAQAPPNVDSLVAHFLTRGALSSWQPHALMTGCPDLEPWQERGLNSLLSANLSVERENDLASALMFALRDCRSGRLEQWYFDRFDESMSSGGDSDPRLPFWDAFTIADSPGIRDYLRRLMLDESRPTQARAAAGAKLFARLTAEEQIVEYMLGFVSGRLPDEVAWGQTDVLLKRAPDRLLAEVGSAVESNPSLVEQSAFMMVVEVSPDVAGVDARRRFGESLRRAAERSSGERRTVIEAAARNVVRSPR